MVFLNALWMLTDLVYIPLLGLSEIDFYVKVIVNAILAIGLALSGRRAGDGSVRRPALRHGTCSHLAMPARSAITFAVVSAALIVHAATAPVLRSAN